MPSQTRRFNPWIFIPVLYFMQSIPVAVVQELSTIIYKDLGIENELITRWTSLIALPWAMQMLLGPLVDLNMTKRWWVLNGQFVIAIGLGVAAFMLQTPQAFTFSLVALGIAAIFSALTNIATDGFALLAMDKTQQAQFAGIMSTFFRLGRLFCTGLLVFFAGTLMRLPEISVSGAPMIFELNGQTKTLSEASLKVDSGLLKNSDGWVVQPKIEVPPGTYAMRVEPDGKVFARQLAGEKEVGAIPTEGATLTTSGPVETRNPQAAWTLVLLIGLGLYGVGHAYNRFMVPRPEKDVEAEPVPGETKRNIARTLILVAIGLGGYFFLNSVVRLGAHFLWQAFDGKVPEAGTKDFVGLQGWMLPADNNIPFLNKLSFGGVGTELFQLAVTGALLFLALGLARKLLRGSEMATAMVTYVRQDGFPAILFFILFYRVGEVIVGRITPLFLKGSLAEGGLAISNEQLGVLSGILGVVGIVIGGIVGGLMVSKFGLKKCFIPLALAMHVPNLLYLWASLKTMPMIMWGDLNVSLGAMLFVDQFGYGFGFAAYMIYLMWVAQRGKFVTSHYAIGVGMGALTIAVAGVISGILQKQFGYTGTFIAVLFLSIPGLLSLFFIPLDESHKQIKAEVE